MTGERWELQPRRGSLLERLLCRIGLHLFMPDRGAPGGASCCLCRTPLLKDSANPADEHGGPVPLTDPPSPQSPKEGT